MHEVLFKYLHALSANLHKIPMWEVIIIDLILQMIKLRV